MSPLTIAWSMCAAASAMLGLMHLTIWLKNRRTYVYALSALMAFSAAANALLELGMLHTQMLDRYIVLMRWENTAVFGLVAPLVWFVYLYFQTARRWLAITITALWSIALLINFLSPNTLVFAESVELRILPTYWGETFTVAFGPNNPWKWLPDIASLLIVFYVLDASLRLWRKGNRRRALVVGGGIILFMLIGGLHSPLVDAGRINTPYMVAFAFLAIVMTMSYELVSDAVQVSRYHREIQANEERWRSLMDQVQLAVIGIDMQGLINYINPFLKRLLGFTQDELLGRSVAGLISGAVEHRLQLAMQHGPRPHSRWTLIGKSGEQRDLAWSSVLLRDADGASVGILSVGADITDQLTAERELQKTRQEMEHLARVNMLGELASALAHELNQPLAAILSNAQAARRFMNTDHPDLDEIREILDDIIDEDKRAGEIIHRMRALLQTGEINHERFDLNDMVQEVVRLLDGEFHTQDVMLRTYYLPENLRVEAGRVEMQQVMMNLLLNAIRAIQDTPMGQREIQIHTGRQERTIFVRVEDNGPGIPEEQLPRLFEPFFTTRSGGLGMGLAICRRIIEAHGGRIQADNIPGAGARFTFFLPDLHDLKYRAS